MHNTQLDNAIAVLEGMLPTLRRKAQRAELQKGINLIKEAGLAPAAPMVTPESPQAEPVIGRGLLQPTVFYGDEAEEVQRLLVLVEGLQTILSYPGDMSDVDIGRIESTVENLLERVEVLKRPTHTLDSVGELREIVDVLAAIYAEEPLPAHVRYDLGNIVKSMEGLIAGNIAEPVDHKDAAGGVRLVDRFEHTLERLDVCADAHPLDISQRDLRDATLYLRAILQNNRGWQNLGKEGYVVVPTRLHGGVVDALTPFLVAYGEGRHMAKDLRSQAALVGSPAMTLLPDWFSGTYGHTSKGGFVSLMYHCAVEASLVPEGNLQSVYFGYDAIQRLEAKVEAGDKRAFKDYVSQKLQGGNSE